eukprot:TRINITY_DN22650_c0_g1_i1.p1 TRINITY_DN22650_c0_g1~~TRINITY_DN22650_c0_g1_i1.p1  ORF type:complete len:634 (+),score=54.55 TRINITY_DN22650_c0_g1_i1:66-1904(+)
MTTSCFCLPLARLVRKPWRSERMHTPTRSTFDGVVAEATPVSPRSASRDLPQLPLRREASENVDERRGSACDCVQLPSSPPTPIRLRNECSSVPLHHQHCKGLLTSSVECDGSDLRSTPMAPTRQQFFAAPMIETCPHVSKEPEQMQMAASSGALFDAQRRHSFSEGTAGKHAKLHVTYLDRTIARCEIRLKDLEALTTSDPRASDMIYKECSRLLDSLENVMGSALHCGLTRGVPGATELFEHALELVTRAGELQRRCGDLQGLQSRPCPVSQQTSRDYTDRAVPSAMPPQDSICDTSAQTRAISSVKTMLQSSPAPSSGVASTALFSNESPRTPVSTMSTPSQTASLKLHEATRIARRLGTESSTLARQEAYRGCQLAWNLAGKGAAQAESCVNEFTNSAMHAATKAAMGANSALNKCLQHVQERLEQVNQEDSEGSDTSSDCEDAAIQQHAEQPALRGISAEAPLPSVQWNSACPAPLSDSSVRSWLVPPTSSLRLNQPHESSRVLSGPHTIPVMVQPHVVRPAWPSPAITTFPLPPAPLHHIQSSALPMHQGQLHSFSSSLQPSFPPRTALGVPPSTAMMPPPPLQRATVAPAGLRSAPWALGTAQLL